MKIGRVYPRAELIMEKPIRVSKIIKLVRCHLLPPSIPLSQYTQAELKPNLTRTRSTTLNLSWHFDLESRSRVYLVTTRLWTTILRREAQRIIEFVATFAVKRSSLQVFAVVLLFFIFVRSVQMPRTIVAGLLDRRKSEKCNQELLPRVVTNWARDLIAAVIRASNYGSLTDGRRPLLPRFPIRISRNPRCFTIFR